MATADTHAKPSVPGTDGVVAGGCAVCAHVWAEHDVIAARYCTATAAGKFERGCVCTADATVEPPG
jgi:hypothetical protein